MKLTLAMIAALASPALAYKSADQVLVPPPQYNNQMGAKYTGAFKRILTTLPEVQRLCNDPRALACAKRPLNPIGKPAASCTVIMPNDLPADLYRAVNTHEVGHCLGWRHTAPEPQ